MGERLSNLQPPPSLSQHQGQEQKTLERVSSSCSGPAVGLGGRGATKWLHAVSANLPKSDCTFRCTKKAT